MVRPVWLSQRYSEADTSESLQSDVMRFMAIIALCLVAIFALVQSLPLRPVEPITEPLPAPVEKVAAVPQSVTEPPAAVSVPSRGVSQLQPEQLLQTIPKPKLDKPMVDQSSVSSPVEQYLPEPVDTIPMPTKNLTTVSLQEPSLPLENVNVDQPQPAPEELDTTSVSDIQQGLSLRFASDSALLALVAKRRVDVYGWVDKAAWKLLSERGRLSFVPASVPKRFHSMTPETVPDAIVRSLNSNVPGMNANSITWGVTLPADTTRQLEHLVNKHRSGTLVIYANGRVRFESSG